MRRFGLHPARWIMRPDPVRDAPEMIHELVCTTCEVASGAQGDFDAVRDWAFAHTDANPTHLRYFEMAARPWRLVPADGDRR
ncbi:DUF7848 domain-containing protein [Streptomyces jumonjinensis]